MKGLGGYTLDNREKEFQSDTKSGENFNRVGGRRSIKRSGCGVTSIGTCPRAVGYHGGLIDRG